ARQGTHLTDLREPELAAPRKRERELACGRRSERKRTLSRLAVPKSAKVELRRRVLGTVADRRRSYSGIHLRRSGRWRGRGMRCDANRRAHLAGGRGLCYRCLQTAGKQRDHKATNCLHLNSPVTGIRQAACLLSPCFSREGSSFCQVLCAIMR